MNSKIIIWVCVVVLGTMSACCIMAGLIPILWSTGVGSEVMQRIAVPMIGGMVSSTVLTLIVIPALFALIRRREIVGKAEPG